VVYIRPRSNHAEGRFLQEPFGLSVFEIWPSLFLGHRSGLDMFPRHASAQSQIHLSGDKHSS
jgi:hypothetical protein